MLLRLSAHFWSDPLFLGRALVSRYLADPRIEPSAVFVVGRGCSTTRGDEGTMRLHVRGGDRASALRLCCDALAYQREPFLSCRAILRTPIIDLDGLKRPCV